jgi:hypothetical protein
MTITLKTWQAFRRLGRGFVHGGFSFGVNPYDQDLVDKIVNFRSVMRRIKLVPSQAAALMGICQYILQMIPGVSLYVFCHMIRIDEWDLCITCSRDADVFAMYYSAVV